MTHSKKELLANEEPLGAADLAALETALGAAEPIAGNAEFRMRLLEDFDNLQRERRRPDRLAELLAGAKRILGARALAPAGLLAGVTALGFAAGAASAGVGYTDEQAAAFVTAAIDQAFMPEEEIPNWVED
jgi:hypothetical protein